MWYVTVTIPTGFPVAYLSLSKLYHTRVYKFCVQLSMTTNAIVHYHTAAGLTCTYHLRLRLKCEYGRMVQTIYRFKIVFVESIVLRHVTIVARGLIAM